MASAYSTPKQFDNYVQPVNLELVNFVLGSKEQKFNYNIAKVEQTLQDFGQLGLVRDQDKEYLADRVNTMLTQMGDIENADWSDSNIERQISSGIRGSIDDRVRNDIQKSRSYTSYMKNVQAIKEKEPEKYSDINFAMGLKNAGADKWVNGESDEMGNLNYTPFVDVQGEQNKFVQDFIKTHGDERVEEIDGELNGVKIKRTIKGISKEQAATIFEANMSPQQRQQLQMEADFYYGQAPEEQQGKVIQNYQDNIRKEVKIHKNSIDLLKANIAGLKDGEEKNQKLAQLAESEKNVATIESSLNKGVDYKTAYSDSYYQNVKNTIVGANSFERVTDIKRDKTLLDAMKITNDIATSTAEATSAAAVASGSNLTVAPSGGINTDDSKLEIYTKQVQTQLGKSINKFSAVATQVANDPSIDFEKSFGISSQEFKKKTKEEKESFLTARFDGFDKGIDMKGGNLPPEVVNAYLEYKTSSNAFESVNSGIKATSETIAKKTFDGMVEGFKKGTFQSDNFQNEVIKNIIQKSGREDLSFESLSPDEQKAFRVAMIDESIRGNHIDQDEIMPYLLANRKELLESIENKGLKAKFLSNDRINDSNVVNTFGGMWERTKSVLNAIGETIAAPNNLLGGREVYSETRKANAKAGEYGDEMVRRANPANWFKRDETLWALDSGDTPLEGDDRDVSNVIKSEYKAAVNKAREAAGEAAVKMPSTYVISLSPNIKAEKDLATKAAQRIAIDKGYGTEDVGKNAIQVHYNKADNSVQFSTVLKRTAQEGYEINNRIYSDPVAINQLTDMPEIMNRIQKDDSNWALDSKNPNAVPITFKTTGFETTKEQKEAIERVSKYLPQDAVGRLNAAPNSVGYTKTKVSTLLEDNVRQTQSGEQRRFVEEFPNTFNSLTSGQGEFEINYKSTQGEGYYVSVDYVLGKNRIPMSTPRFVGESIDYQREYINSFQIQKEMIDAIDKGYGIGNTDIIDKLKEIEQLYGK